MSEKLEFDPGPATTGGPTLPRSAYVDSGHFAIEQERVFARRWVSAGLARDLPPRNGACPKTVAGMPILFVTDAEGVTRGFQNMCRHRGSRLVSEPCDGLAVLTCPYHRWCYALDGALLSRPHYFGPDRHERLGAPSAEDGLIPIQIDVWHDWVFVNLDREAPPFSSVIADAEAILEGYALDGLRWFRTLDYEVKGNWKLAVENFWDPTHSFAIHPQFMTAGTSDRRTPAQARGNVIHGHVPFDSDADVVAESGRAAPKLPGPREAVDGSFWLALFPNFAMSFLPTNLAVFELQPLGPALTVERLHLYMAGDAATDPNLAAARDAVAAFWHETNKQDLDAVRWMQEGRMCPGFDGGLLAPFWDGAVSAFGDMVREAIRVGR